MGEAEGMRLTEHQRHWLEQIQACEASGKSVAAYASGHGFPADSIGVTGKIGDLLVGVLIKILVPNLMLKPILD